MATDPNKKHRMAVFREKVRDILREDKWKRESGISVDTGGRLARAMEKAYQQGLDDAVDPPEVPARGTDDPIPWVEIPSRAKKILWRFYLWSFDANTGKPVDEKAVFYVQLGGGKWFALVYCQDDCIINTAEDYDDKGVADSTMKMLIDRNLLSLSHSDNGVPILSLTEKGSRTILDNTEFDDDSGLWKLWP